MKRVIAISGIGDVGFPDEMTDADVSQAAEDLQRRVKTAIRRHRIGPDTDSGQPTNFNRKQTIRNVLARGPRR